MKIFKYPLKEIISVISMPINAKILSVQTQREDICVWAEVNDAADKEDRRFYVSPTGANIPFPESQRKFLGTVQLADGDLVFHIYEVL